MSETWRLTAAASVTLAIYVIVYWTQNVPISRMQAALIGSLLPFEIINLVHGVRMLAAWLFGWWSIAVLAPATLFIYANSFFGNGSEINLEFHLVVATYLLSGPLSLHIIGLVLPERNRASRFEWRVLLLAGFMAAFLNSTALGILLVPFDPVNAGLAWLFWHVVSQVLGLLFFLMIIMLFLRWRGQGPSA